jgi:molybdenum cofactor cytidylyltransferase
MTRAPSYAGVILAAGESSRMGTDKALLPWPPSAAGRIPGRGTFLSAAIESLSLEADFVVVVAGRNEAALAPVVYANGASLVVNPDPDRGQFSSLQVGLHDVLNRGRDTALVTLVDRPPANPATIAALRRAFDAADKSVWAVIPQFEGRHGHPILAGRDLIEAFLQAPATSTARDIEHRYQEHLLYVTVTDPFVALNVNTAEDYASLMALPHSQAIPRP